MNRKKNRGLLLTTLLAISSTTLFSAAAQAQVVKGSFTLPCPVKWGAGTLPAGNYTFVARSSDAPFFLTVRGEKTAAMIIAHVRRTLTGNRSSIEITREGDQVSVSALELAPYGLRFEYGIGHRRPKAQQALNKAAGPNAQAEARVIQIPVTVVGE